MREPHIVRRLRAEDAGIYRELRLDSLRRFPAAFGSSWEEASAQPMDWFAARLEGQVVWGGWLGSHGLCGIAGLYVASSIKKQHIANIIGVYVCPAVQGSGLGQALIEKLIEYAGGRFEMLLLTVEASNMAACRLYEKVGFEEYGREPRALKVNGVYYDEVLMALPLADDANQC